MRILSVDPGPEKSAWLVFDCDTGLPMRNFWHLGLAAGIDPNRPVRTTVAAASACAVDSVAHLVIEQVEHYGQGMPAGKSVFDTCIAIGRFMEAWGDDDSIRLLPRRTVKLHLCGSARAKDANVRQALLDRFPATGGGKTPQVGTKKAPGPLYGIKSHLWSALALAVTWAETRETT